MIRFKNFNATGVAPDGRLYAGDLNLLEDTVAALADFTQNLQVGSIAIGDATLNITKYGAGEMAAAGALRVTGILRSLGGAIDAVMSSATRDGLAVGAAPYGLRILNTTTNRLEYNAGTDGARNWQPVGLNGAGQLVFGDGSSISTAPSPGVSMGLVVALS